MNKQKTNIINQTKLRMRRFLLKKNVQSFCTKYRQAFAFKSRKTSYWLKNKADKVLYDAIIPCVLVYNTY